MLIHQGGGGDGAAAGSRGPQVCQGSHVQINILAKPGHQLTAPGRRSHPKSDRNYLMHYLIPSLVLLSAVVTVGWEELGRGPRFPEMNPFAMESRVSEVQGHLEGLQHLMTRMM